MFKIAVIGILASILVVASLNAKANVERFKYLEAHCAKGE